jgi:hypothetical protein
VVQLTPVPPLKQLEELVAKSNFEAALALIKDEGGGGGRARYGYDQKWRDSKPQHLEHVRTL